MNKAMGLPHGRSRGGEDRAPFQRTGTEPNQYVAGECNLAAPPYLTDEQIEDIAQATFAVVQDLPDAQVSGTTWDRYFARAVEREARRLDPVRTRNSFEAWAPTEGYCITRLVASGTTYGAYERDSTQQAWVVWQAATESAQQGRVPAATSKAG
jgi:hypothetical protein